MSQHCVCCGSPIPDDQGSRTCSMCYGDIDHGKDGYYRQAMEDDYRLQQEREQAEHEAAERLEEGEKP